MKHFGEKIPNRENAVFFRFQTYKELTWKKAYFWSYDEYLKTGYFVVKGDFTTYPISPRTVYEEYEQ